MKVTTKLLLIQSLCLMGCATAPDYVKKDWPVQLGHAQYTIPVSLIDASLDRDIISKYVQSVKEATGYRLAYFDQNNNHVGVLVERTNDGVMVGYLRKGTPNLYHNYYATFATKLSANSKETILDVTCPQNLIQENKNFLGEWQPIISIDSARMDLAKICKNATILFNKRESGEVNVNYGDSAVYANFARKLKPVTWKSDDVKKDDIAKYRWFEIIDGDATRKLGVTVYPYRNGSKVTYVWERTVSCRANLGCNYDPNASKRINDLVMAIAND